MIAYVIVLYLSVINPDTGEMLYDYHIALPRIKSEDPVKAFQDCLHMGAAKAGELAKVWRAVYPNAFAHVNCKWEQQS